MKRLVILVVLVFMFFFCKAPEYRILPIPVGKVINPFERIWMAICIHESKLNPLAYNPLEQAFGIVQIRQCKLDDFNDETGKHYTLIDMFDVSKSKEVFMHFAAKHQSWDLEYVAKDWNGSGEMTISYWDSVQTIYKRIQDSQ